jgi:Cellulose biosynthesis protein BcsS
VRAWGMLIAACVLASSAVAEEQAGSGATHDGRSSAKVLLFSGADFWRNGAFLHGGLMWSPGGLDQDGFTLKLLIGGGTYRYDSGLLGTEVIGRQYFGSALAGWRVKSEGFEATIFIGPDLQDHKLDPDDPGARLRGRYLGVRAGLDVWYEPWPGVMTAFNGSAAAPTSDFSLRAAAGIRLFDRVFVGPEGQVFGCADYRQYRAGLHATALKVGKLEWSAGGGWVTDSDRRSGAYGRIGVLARY